VVDRIDTESVQVGFFRLLRIGNQTAQFPLACGFSIVGGLRRQQCIDFPFDEQVLEVAIGRLKGHTRQRCKALLSTHYPLQILPLHSVLIGKDAARPDRGGHRKIRDTDPFSTQIGRFAQRAVLAHIER
jgi:hypothetical protein